MDKARAAKSLIALCEKSLQENEYNTRKIKGVSCSHSDVETIELYALTFLRTGSFDSLMKPRCEVEAVLRKVGLL